MNAFHKILIKYILGLDENDQHLKKLFIIANTFAGGLGDWNMLDPVSASILEHLQTMTEEEQVMVLRFIHSIKDFREVTA